MMGIVAQEYDFVILDLEIETTVYSVETCHTLLDLFVCRTIEVGECHGCYAILYIDADGNTQLDIINTRVGCNKINKDLTISDTDILCVEISFGTGVTIDFYTGLHIRFQSDVLVYNECTTRLDKRRIMTKTFQVGFFCAINIQMVGICGSYYAHVR